MEWGSLKNEVAERFLRLPETSGVFARDLLAIWTDSALGPVWRNYCIQLLGREDSALRLEGGFVRPGCSARTCGTL